MKIQSVIIQPVVSEKSFDGSENGVYTFRVAKNANKFQVKDEIERLFKVKVEKVRVLNQRGKRMTDWKTRKMSSRKDFKKAVVTLKSGDTIDIFK
ncbi:MAG: 50S ribosomal protein L23 [Patescibacteria group bacterium]|nr:50S ribosomal protein L23 [Patescibacteria group bacterium]